MKPRAAILVRASSSKQAIDNITHEQQLRECKFYIEKQGWEKVKIFTLIESGAAEEREYFQDVLDYCLDKKNKIDYVVFLNIGRFTREGSAGYSKWKKKLSEVGVKIRDVYDTIQDDKNTLESRGFEYKWSKFSPSESQEILEAEKFKSERRDILTRLIGAEIDYVNLGYWVRQAPFGFSSTKVETEKHGKRCVLVENAKESFFVKKAFQLRVQGKTYTEIADSLNELGYRSRTKKKRDPKTKRAIGELGNKPIDSNRVQEILERVIYVGIVCQKWTNYLPIKARFPGFISIEFFNKANKGRKKIIANNEQIIVKEGEELTKERIAKRKKHNPLYPFKNVVKCPICGDKLKGSAPKKKYPQYHCHKGHKHWYEYSETFNKNVYDFIRDVDFNEDFGKLYRELFFEKYDPLRSSVIEESARAEKYIADLKTEQLSVSQVSVSQAFRAASSEALRKQLEKQFDELEKKI
jgi:DNA invertase Pin-like site-specific DNA recombinase